VASKLAGFLTELKRRKVYHVGAAYLAVGAAVVFGVPDLFASFDLPQSAVQLAIIVVAIGFPVALVLAWLFEVRPEGKEGSAEVAPAGAVVGTAVHTEKSIVVLPFDNMSPDPGDAYFSDGLTEEIITDLSFLKSLRVISRSSAMALKGTQKDLPTLGKELNVRYVLEGSVRKAGNDLRITAQLIDAQTDAHLWAEKYDGDLDDVFGIQEEVSRAIVKALELELNPEEEERLSENPIGDTGAFDVYQKAHHDIRTGSKESLTRAEKHLGEAFDIVGENALLFAEMALLDFMLVDTWVRPGQETLDHAEKLVWKSLKLDPEFARGHHLLGRIERYRGTATSAVRHFEQAFRRDPNDTENLLWLGWIYPFFLGKPVTARSFADRLLEVDPLAPMGHVPSAWIDWMEGSYEQALAHLDAGHKINPQVGWYLFFKTQILARMGNIDGCLQVVDEAVEGHPSDGVGPLCSLFRSALVGDEAAFLEQLEGMRETLWTDPECPFWMAGWTALLGRVDDSIEWLERALERGWINYPLIAHDDPFLESVRSDPRFVQLMERLKPEWEGFEA
jgi:non-specific serine/threonine protein kinase